CSDISAERASESKSGAEFSQGGLAAEERAALRGWNAHEARHVYWKRPFTRHSCMNAKSNSLKPAAPSGKARLQRRLRVLGTRTRELMRIGKALASTKHPFLVHVIHMRRCNLACGYCNEFDDVSKPVPIEEMKQRLDLLADMG